MFNSMFDELKEVRKVLKRNNRFQESFKVKYFKEIKRLKSPQKAEVYSEPTMELLYECTKGLTIFAIKAPSQIFDWVIYKPPK